MAAKFVDVSESEIDQFKENAVPQKTKDAAKFGVKRMIKFLFCKQHSLLKTCMFVYIFLASKCRQLLVTFAKYFLLQNGFNSSGSPQMK